MLQHGILPGLAIGAVAAGLSVWAMGLGGFVAGLLVAVLAGALARATGGREDSQLAATYLVALALGVAIISQTRSIDLEHLLFGSVLAVDDTALLLMAGAATAVLFGLVAGFTALGTLMAVGLLMLPAVAARHWAAGLAGQVRAAVLLAALASLAGLHASYDFNLPTGPAIVLAAGAIWAASLCAGPHASLARRWLRRPHLSG